MKLVTYNIHYAVGRDGRADITRIADAVRHKTPTLTVPVSR